MSVAVNENEAFELGYLMEALYKKANILVSGKNLAGMDTEDIIQELVIKGYLAFKSYDRNKASVKTYIDIVLRNQLKDLLKKVGSRKNLAFVNAVSISESVEDEDDIDSPVQVGVEENGYNDIEIQDILEKVELTEQEKKVVYLRLQGFDCSEIAKQLNVSKPRISQIMKNLQKKISKYLNC